MARTAGHPPSPSDDAELVRALAAGDDAALALALELHGPAVLGLARRISPDAAAAEEVAQDTFVALWERPGAYDPARGTLRAYLLGVARFKAVDAVRRDAARARARARLAPASGEAGVAEADERATVRRALRELTALQREAVFLAYFGGLTCREVARELGVPVGTAKTRLRAGLARLRALLEVPATA